MISARCVKSSRPRAWVRRRNVSGVRLSYRVPLTPDEAAARLRAQVDRPSLLYSVVPGLTTGAPFVGSVTSSGFDIRVRRRSANSLAPHEVGIFRAMATGTEIEATIGVGAAIRHALAALIGLIGVLSMPAELSAGVPAPLVIAIATVCVTAAIIVWIRDGEDLGFPASEGRELKDLLNSTFESQREAQAKRPIT